jgi:RimJ/RimL family protein N-acetyltransferase
MTGLGPVAWPPAPIRTERLVLRESEARDRAAYIELLASPEVGTYVGGPRPRHELERSMPGAPQTANVRSMRLAAKLGFIEVERFEHYGAEQWFGVWSSFTPSD